MRTLIWPGLDIFLGVRIRILVHLNSDSQMDEDADPDSAGSEYFLGGRIRILVHLNLDPQLWTGCRANLIYGWSLGL